MFNKLKVKQPEINIEADTKTIDIKEKHWKRGLEIAQEKGQIIAEMHDINMTLLEMSEKIREHYKRLKMLNAEASKWAIDAGVEPGQKFNVSKEKPQINVFGIKRINNLDSVKKEEK